MQCTRKSAYVFGQKHFVQSTVPFKERQLVLFRWKEKNGKETYIHVPICK